MSHPWFGNGKASTTAHARRKQASFRPRLELLEDRLAPAALTLNVTTTLDVVDANDGKLSLREAITRANNHAGADIIMLPAGVFKMARPGPGDDANLSGDFDITDGVLLRGAGAGDTAVNARRLDGVFHIQGALDSPISVTFQSLTIRNGSSGGGIMAVYHNLVVRDSVVTGNAGVNGGGISTYYGDVKVIRSSVSGNTSQQFGGGGISIFNGHLKVIGSTVSGNSLDNHSGGGITADTVTLINSTVSGNSTAAGEGGGIYAGTVTMTNSTVSGNVTTSLGGGIYGGTVTLNNSTVSGNSAGRAAGGIHAVTVNMTNSTVSGNTAGSSAGGIYANTVTLTNSTVSSNSANVKGGGIQLERGRLLNATIVGNFAPSGGGVLNEFTGTVAVKNTLIARNRGATGVDVQGVFLSEGHNLIGDGAGGTGFGAAGDRIGTFLAPVDPKLGPLKKNGGPTRTHALLRGSPAIDRGDNTEAPRKDQRGVRRPRDGGGDPSRVVDIGAFER